MSPRGAGIRRALFLPVAALWPYHLRAMLLARNDWFLNARMVAGLIRFAIILGVLAFSAISSWLIGRKMRREIKQDLGRRATPEDLSDIDTWMEVREAEDQALAEKPPHEKK